MPYKYIVEFKSPQILFDLQRPIDVLKAIIEALNGKIRGCNFNKYYEPSAGSKPRISVRLDLQDAMRKLLQKF
jgi:hypothetical protein